MQGQQTFKRGQQNESESTASSSILLVTTLTGWQRDGTTGPRSGIVGPKFPLWTTGVRCRREPRLFLTFSPS